MKFQLKNKKKTVLIILIIISILFFLLYLFIPFLKIGAAKIEFKNYFLNDFDLSTIKSTKKNESFNAYERSFIERSIKDFKRKEDKLNLIEYLDVVKDIKTSFKSQCTEENFEKCDPYKILMPYCIIIKNPDLWLNEEDLKIFEKEINKDTTYNNAMRYWKTYIEEKELKENDLSIFVGFVTAEKLCGDLNQYDVENLLKKLLKIQIDKDQSVEERVYSLKKKVSVIKELENTNYSNERSYHQNSNSPICHELPKIDEIEKIDNICATHDYYRVKAFCTKEDVVNSVRDYLLVTRYLEKRYSNLDEIICQLSFYYLTEK